MSVDLMISPITRTPSPIDNATIAMILLSSIYKIAKS